VSATYLILALSCDLQSFRPLDRRYEMVLIEDSCASSPSTLLSTLGDTAIAVYTELELLATVSTVSVDCLSRLSSHIDASAMIPLSFALGVIGIIAQDHEGAVVLAIADAPEFSRRIVVSRIVLDFIG
jgi:hypothetical protein